MFEIHRQVWVPRSRDAVFEFFRDARNLGDITPPWVNFNIHEIPQEMRAGAMIRYTLKVHGVPIRWRTEITEWNPPFGFVDEQRKGPYKLWRHSHRFEEKDGGTIVFDDVEYELPLGPIGRIVHWLQVRRDLKQIFDYREKRIIDLLK